MLHIIFSKFHHPIIITEPHGFPRSLHRSNPQIRNGCLSIYIRHCDIFAFGFLLFLLTIWDWTSPLLALGTVSALIDWLYIHFFVGLINVVNQLNILIVKFHGLSIRAIFTSFGTPQNITSVQSLEFRSALHSLLAAGGLNEKNERRIEWRVKRLSVSLLKLLPLMTMIIIASTYTTLVKVCSPWIYQASTMVKTLFNGSSTYTYNYSHTHTQDMPLSKVHH